jgi:hypothetical protein
MKALKINTDRLLKACNGVGGTGIHQICQNLSYVPESRDPELQEYEHSFICNQIEIEMLRRLKEDVEHGADGTRIMSTEEAARLTSPDRQPSAEYFISPYYRGQRLAQLWHSLRNFSDSGIERLSREAAYDGLRVPIEDYDISCRHRRYWNRVQNRHHSAYDTAARNAASFKPNVPNSGSSLRDVIAFADFLNSPERLAEGRELIKKEDAAQKLSQLISSSYRDKDPFEFMTKNGELNYELCKSYKKHKAKLRRERKGILSRINSHILKLQQEYITPYEVFKEDLLKNRAAEIQRQAVVKARELASKRAEEKKKYNALQVKLSNGYGCGETDSKGKPKDSYASEEEAKRMIIKIASREAKLLDCYKKTYSTPDGTGKTVRFSRWFLTSKNVVMAA